jgi:hypothetical protein
VKDKRNDLFMQYLEDVNHLDDESNKTKDIGMSKIEYALVIVILSCMGLMTIWECMKEIVMKLRF